MDPMPRIAVVTFATTKSDKPFKNYSLEIKRLRDSTSKYNVDFHVFTLDNLRRSISGTRFKHYIRFRKGVGGWFWKPTVILKYLKENQYDYVLYMDVDCVLLKDPLIIINSLPRNVEFAGFSMNACIGDWTAARIIKSLAAEELKNCNMWTAGILIVKNTKSSAEYLTMWSEIMSNPYDLFESPFDPDKSKHRHDQSLLSILIARGDVKIHDLGAGFYSEGIEATSKNIGESWVATGVNIGNPLHISQVGFLARLHREIRHRYLGLMSGALWLFFIPLHFFAKQKR